VFLQQYKADGKYKGFLSEACILQGFLKAVVGAGAIWKTAVWAVLLLLTINYIFF